MRSPKAVFLSLAFPCLLTGAVPASPQSVGGNPADAVSKARSLYYTPVDRGLQGFHCDVNFDWKNFLQKAANQPVPDDDARLRYLQTIQLSVEDDLHGAGELHWTAPTTAPDGTEDSVSKIRGGMQGILSDFFQSWNGYFTGDLMTLDARSVVERTATGYRVSVRTGPSLAEEIYDSSLVLKSIHVTTPTLDSTIVPTFMPGPQGLLVSTVGGSYRQPPSTPPTDVTTTLSYAPVGAYQIPSEISVTVDAAAFEFHLVNCTVRSQITPK